MDERTSKLVEAATVAVSKHLITRWQRVIALLPDKLEEADTTRQLHDMTFGFSYAVQTLDDQDCTTPADLRTAGGLMLRKIKEIKEIPVAERFAMYHSILQHCANECMDQASNIEREAKHAEFQGFEKPEQHAPECYAHYQNDVIRTRESALEALAYIARWPGVCHACNGAGGFNHYSYDSGWDFEPCSCAEAGRCPRCGNLFLQEGDKEEKCPSCGWDSQNPDVMPDYDGGYDCYGDCKGEFAWQA